MRIFVKKCGAVCVSVLLLFSMFCCAAGGALAAATREGEVTGDAVALRNDAGTSGTTVLTRLYTGDKVTVLGEKNDKDGDMWYNVQTKDGKYKGYMYSQWVRIIEEIEYKPDADFEAYLTAQKFPESYKDGLRKLHAQYPNWVFVAQHLKPTWSEALDAEAQVGRSLVDTHSAYTSWKSMEYGAYNWDKKAYVWFDSGGWVAAQREVVAYYMDPRNFLNDTSIFQFESLSYSSVHTEAGVKKILAGSFMENMAKDFMDAATQTSVSVYHLASRAYQEQGKTGNQLGKGTVPNFTYNGATQSVSGYYNIFDIRAYKTDTLSAMQNGALYAKSKGWDTARKSILGGAQILGDGYINKGQNTLYLQKFDFVDGGNGYYNHQYMTNIAAAASEAAIAKKAYTDEMLNGALVFNVPVFAGMPDKPCAAPEKSNKNNDNTLTALAVEGYSLTPSFSRYTTEYAVTLPADVASAKVKATKSDSGASVSGDGTINLSGEETTVKIKVTAPSGLVRTYTVHIYRPGASGTPSVSSSTYKIGEHVTGIKAGVSAADFLKGFTVTNGTLQVVDAAGKAVTGKVATGHKLQTLSGGKVYASYPLVIYGDVSGDGAVTTKDLLIAQKHILGISKISGAALTAADSGKDGKLTTADLLRTQKQILGITSPIV